MCPTIAFTSQPYAEIPVNGLFDWQCCTASAVLWTVSAPTLDVHTHFFPPGLHDFADKTGDARWPSLHLNNDATQSATIMRGPSTFRPVNATCWNIERRSEQLAPTSITRQVLSPVPVTLTSWADPKLANDFLRAQNDAFAAAVASATMGTYEWMGAVPLQDPALAALELERGVRQLGMVGVEIGTEVGGVELDDVRFAEFFSAAEELDVPIFIHPTDGNAIRRGGVPYEFALGMLTDTATAVTALVFGGVMDRHPKLRIGLSHGCGTFPWTYPRLVRGQSLKPGAQLPEEIRSHTDGLLRRLWADTLVFDPAHLPLLKDRFGADHLMLGSDFPFYPASFGDPVDMLNEAVRCGYCSDAERDNILGPNATEFLGLGKPK
jgi:aminocarboxymuconate-semialdehyde decarboxylase